MTENLCINALAPDWEFVSDKVMGGISEGEVVQCADEGARLTGQVSLENNGGFVQMAFDLEPDGAARDVSDWTGLQMEVRGNDERYEVRLRTEQLSRPWQSYMLDFHATSEWQTLQLPFGHFMPHRTEIPLELTALRRVGVLGIGREFFADITVKSVALYR